MAAPSPAAAPRLIRPAAPADMAAIQAIYADHVLTGLATFETLPPGAAELERRRQAVVAAGMPYLVAEVAGAVVGYAYASSWRPRPAYRHTVEDSVYLARGMAGRGHGRALLGALIRESEAAGFRQMVAVIGDSANAASIGLHLAQGFAHAGVLRDVGFKLGRFVDTVLMQRPLGPGAGLPPG